jgi:hypothetical protein
MMMAKVPAPAAAAPVPMVVRHLQKPDDAHRCQYASDHDRFLSP